MPACGWAACLTCDATQSYMRSAGHLGWAFPPASARNARHPDRPVVVFTGDAGFWYHIGEIKTAVRWNINSVTVVNNNGGGNQSKRGFDRAYGGEQTEQARELWTYKMVNFAASPRTSGRSASGSKSPPSSPRRSSARWRRTPGGDRRRDRHRGAGADRGGAEPAKENARASSPGVGFARYLSRSEVGLSVVFVSVVVDSVPVNIVVDVVVVVVGDIVLMDAHVRQVESVDVESVDVVVVVVVVGDVVAVVNVVVGARMTLNVVFSVSVVGAVLVVVNVVVVGANG